MISPAGQRLGHQIHERQQLLDAHRATTAAAPAPTEPKHTVQQLLDFEAEQGEKHTGRKDEAIRTLLGLTPARYYVLLGRAVDTAAAVAHNPQLTNHLLERRGRNDRDRARRR